MERINFEEKLTLKIDLTLFNSSDRSLVGKR